MRYLLLALCLFLVVVCCAQETYTLKYAPEGPATWDETLSGELLDISIAGSTLGYKGNATAKVTAEIVCVDKDNQCTTLKLSLSEIEAKLNGQSSKPSAPEPLTLLVDAAGKMTRPKDAPQGSFSFLDTGGIPLGVIGMLAHTIRFPEGPVAVRQEWVIEGKYDLPGVGQVPVNTRWCVTEVEGDIVTVASTAAAAMPDFKAPNPMGEGQIDIKAGKVYITEMTQTYDMKQSRLLTTKGAAKLEGQAGLQGMMFPLVLQMKYELEPREVEE